MSVPFFRSNGERKWEFVYIVVMDFDQAGWVTRHFNYDLAGFACGHSLIRIAYCVGAGAKLTIGEFEGTIVAPASPPDDWTYPSGRSLEPQWFWEWIPSEDAKEKMQKELNNSNPLGEKPQQFKTMVPYQLERKGDKAAILDGVVLPRLPDLFRSDVPFVFDFNQPVALKVDPSKTIPFWRST